MNANYAKRLKIKFNILFAKRLCIYETALVMNAVKTQTKGINKMKTQVISREIYDTLCARFPNVEQSSYQAGTGEYFVAEFRAGSNVPTRLVHYFSPIL